MAKFKPIHGIVLVVAAVAGLALIDSRSGRSDMKQVRPAPDGVVHINVADLDRGQVRFYRFLNSGNQEVEFFVGRDPQGTVQVAFDASENHFKRRRGFTIQDGWIVDNQCGSSFRLSSVNGGGRGCSPIPLAHRVVGNELQITEPDLLRGWRLFN